MHRSVDLRVLILMREAETNALRPGAMLRLRLYQAKSNEDKAKSKSMGKARVRLRGNAKG